MKHIETEGLARCRPIELNSPASAELPLGCWLVTPRRGYTHHGVYVGDGQVVHYAGLSRSWRRGSVEVASLSDFSVGHGLWMKGTPTARYIGGPAAQRALSRVGEDRYRVMTNNCEHFCAWCLDGENRSRQVERWLAWPRAMLVGLAQVFTIGPPWQALSKP
jgi:hypothetical protein